MYLTIDVRRMWPTFDRPQGDADWLNVDADWLNHGKVISQCQRLCYGGCVTAGG